MAARVALPDWDKAAAWDLKRQSWMDDNPVLRFLLDNEPAGQDGILWREQLAKMLEFVANDAVAAYIIKVDDYLRVQWDDHYYALTQVLLEQQEKENLLDYAQDV